jgi:iron complex outermembrane receptor protein
MKPFNMMLKQQALIKLAFLFFSTFIDLQALVFAQTNLPTLIVSGSRFQENIDRVPANIQVVTKQQILDSTASNLAEVLQQVANVPMSNQGGGLLGIGATPDLGGYGANASNNTLVLIDGVRINPVDSTTAPLNAVPLSAIERIEIINGGASVQYGNNATGGVINVITKDGTAGSNVATMTYGSFGTIDWRCEFTFKNG